MQSVHTEVDPGGALSVTMEVLDPVPVCQLMEMLREIERWALCERQPLRPGSDVR